MIELCTTRSLMLRTHAARGFTLIELMMVLVVLAILVAVAVPSYFESVRKSRRVDAITALNQISQAQERWRSTNATYATQLDATGLKVSAPVSGYYTLSVIGATATGYTATATAAGAQASDTKCASLSLVVANGNLTYSASPAANARKCWNR